MLYPSAYGPQPLSYMLIFRRDAYGQLLVEHLAADGSIRPTKPTFVDNT